MTLMQSLRGGSRGGRDLDIVSKQFDVFEAEISRVVADSAIVTQRAKDLASRLKDFRQEVETNQLMQAVADAQEEATSEA